MRSLYQLWLPWENDLTDGTDSRERPWQRDQAVLTWNLGSTAEVDKLLTSLNFSFLMFKKSKNNMYLLWGNVHLIGLLWYIMDIPFVCFLLPSSPSRVPLL